MAPRGPLAVIDTHPVQYRAPVYQMLAREFDLPITTIYGSDFSVAGYRDREFGACFSWDVDLLSDTNARFLSRVTEGGADSFEKISPRGLGRAIEECGASAVLATGYLPAFNLVGILEARRRRIPVLFRGETSDVVTQRTRLRSAIRNNIVRDAGLRWLYSMCERVLPIGVHARAHYRRLGVPDSKMIASPYCVNTAVFRAGESDREALRESARRELGLAPDDIAILFSGKIAIRKGVHILAAAAKRLPAGLRRRTVLVFLGTGPEDSAVASECAAAPAVRTIFLGFRNQTELSPCYHAADIFALPSIWGETWGLVVNEALHHGLPCIVSSVVGCAPDLIESGVTGAVARAGSAESLANAIEMVAELAGKPVTRAWCRDKVRGYSVRAAAAGIAQAFKHATQWKRMPELVSRGRAV